LRAKWGNPSSIHAEGQAARNALDDARRGVAAVLGATANEIVFTSGGTEASNLAIRGLLRALPDGPKHVVTTAIEHPCVLETCRSLQGDGVAVDFVAVGASGVVDAGEIVRCVRADTMLVSVMHANNETGTLQPVAEVAALVRGLREAGRTIYFHSEGVQAAGRIPLDLHQLGVDLYSMSAHKIYAPKGAGALYVRRGVPLSAIQSGGRHEGGRRAGTENVPGAVALARALALADALADGPRLAALRERLEKQLMARVERVTLNGDYARRLPNTSNLQFADVSGEALAIALDMKGFAVSTGAACSSGSVAPSHVLLAMGLTPAQAMRSVRFSLGRSNSEAQVDALVEAVAASVARLREAPAQSGSRPQPRKKDAYVRR
jgi:cysteine desulfurase